MPQVDAPFGLRPIRRKDGGVVGRVAEYTIASALAANIGVGSLVKRTGTGRNLTIAVDADVVVGVFAGVKFRDAQGNTRYAPNWVSGTVTFNSEAATAYVYDDPQIVFAVRASAGFTATDEGQFAGIVVGVPNAVGVATTKLNSADITGTLDNLKILNVAPFPDNTYGSFAIAEVLIAKHEYRDVISAT